MQKSPNEQRICTKKFIKAKLDAKEGTEKWYPK